MHTTEFNLSSNYRTLTNGMTVIYRLRDINRIVRMLQSDGHYVEPMDLTLGDHPADRHIDSPTYASPFNRKQHLRLIVGEWVTTSIGLIVTKRPS